MGDEELLEIPDDAPDQQTAALALDEMNRAMDALHALPTRQRAIFLAKWRDEKLQSEIAAEFGLHKRSVQKELTRVELYLRKVLRRPKQDRKSVVTGKRGSVRVDHGGGRSIKKKKQN